MHLSPQFAISRVAAISRTAISPQIAIFKALVLQALYNLSDNQTEYQLRDVTAPRDAPLLWIEGRNNIPVLFVNATKFLSFVLCSDHFERIYTCAKRAV
ncbi:MAG: transposase [Novosphingobium sp.]|nr:transposase [Novosphingobium sp.]